MRNILRGRRSSDARAMLVANVRPLLLRSAAESTLRTYRQYFKVFASWCQIHQYRCVPAAADTVALFLVDMAERYRPGTVVGLLNTIALAHRAAGQSFDRSQFDRLVQGIRRQHGTPPRQAPPITVAELRSMVAALPNTLQDARDRALVVVGFAGALRSYELVGLDVGTHTRDSTGTVAIDPSGARIALHKTKGDQTGSGQTKWLPRGGNPCPVEALEYWLMKARITSGPIFRPTTYGIVSCRRLAPQGVSRAVRRLMHLSALRAGLTDEQAKLRTAGYSGHSLRTGFVTSAVMAGVPNQDIAAHVGWKNTKYVFIYARQAEPLRNNPAQLALSS